MKKFLSMVLAGVLMVGCMVPSALAADLDASTQHDIADNGEGTSEVVVTAEATQMTVTVPVSLPASVDAQGNVTVATNAKIINKSYAPVAVSHNVQISATDGWTAKAKDYDFNADNIGTKNFAFWFAKYESDGAVAKLLEGDGVNSVTIYGKGYTELGAAKDEYAFDYNVKISGQSEALSNVKVADVVFTITWAGI